MNLVDAIGKQHVPVTALMQPPRIVSLVPSLTELLCDLGLYRWMVGRTGFCIHPSTLVRGIPKVGGTKSVNIEKIRALAPTHLVVNIDENEKPVVEALAQFIPHVIVTHPLEPLDNLRLYRLFGGIFNAMDQAEQLCAEFDSEYAALARLPRRPPKTVLYCIWQDPWMTVAPDTYIARMLDLIGWKQWMTGEAQRYPRFRWSSQLVETIDEVLLSTEPFRFTQAHADALEQQIGKPVQLVDGELLSWYGSRAIHGLRYLQQLA